SKVNKRVKSNRQTILDGRYAINDLLDKLERHCLRVYQEELAKGTPPVELLKFRLDVFHRQQDGRHAGKPDRPGLWELFERFISGDIRHNGKDKSRNTLRNYATTRAHLMGFDIATRYHVGFENIDLDFLRRYLTYLKEDLGLKPNSIARDIGVLKTVLGEAVDLGYTANMQFRQKKFQAQKVPTEAVHLTEKEVLAIYRCQCAGNTRLEQVRDRFVLGCLAGLPVSGPGGSRPADNKPLLVHSGGETFLSLPARAPGRSGTIRLPCHPVVREILDKRRESGAPWPRPLSNQKFNKYIKELGRLAGLTEKGRLSASPKKELWECLTSGTAGRSLAAHYYHKGIPLHDLMGITGHSSERAFFQYIRLIAASLKKRQQT
ncbi:MAG: site-specific integrase, partial [Bacteroidota bacterium]|nr:site-specific integrase [Bacteroidota bacterium]